MNSLSTPTLDKILAKATPLKPLTTREEEQLKAKNKLITILKYFEIDLAVVNDLRDNQYILALALLESALSNDSKIDVLQALMNGGKTYVVARLLITMLRISDKDAIFFTSYFSQVVEQFLQDITSTKTVAPAVGVIQQMTKELDDRDLYIVANSTLEDEDFNEIADRVSIFSDGQISLHTLDSFDKIRKNRKIKQSIDDGYIITISTIQSSNEVLSKKKQPLLEKSLFGRKSLCIADEFQTGTPLVLDENGEFTYLKVVGFESETYNAVYFDTLKKLNLSHIVGITGTPTIAHKDDKDNFDIKPNLISKEEVLPYGKKVEGIFIDSDNAFDSALERIKSAIDHTVGVINPSIKKDGKKTIATIVLPADSGINSSKMWQSEIEDYLLTKYQLHKSTIAVFHGTITRTGCLSLLELKKACSDVNNPVQIVLVKQKFAAGVNIENISSVAMVKTSINPMEIFNSIHQLWARAIRFYKSFNEADSWNDKEADPTVNTVKYFLPFSHKQAFMDFVKLYAEEV